MRSLLAARCMAKRIARDCPTCMVTGFRHRNSGAYEIDVQDTVTGCPFVITDDDQWTERMAAARFWEEARRD